MWNSSIEVAEHIPSKYESIFHDNIFRHAKEGIILSWAFPGQDGLAHINNKTLRYDFRKMLENNFLVDMTLSKYLQDNCGFQHLKKKLYVYTKILDSNNDELRHWFAWRVQIPSTTIVLWVLDDNTKVYCKQLYATQLMPFILCNTNDCVCLFMVICDTVIRNR